MGQIRSLIWDGFEEKGGTDQERRIGRIGTGHWDGLKKNKGTNYN